MKRLFFLFILLALVPGLFSCKGAGTTGAEPVLTLTPVPKPTETSSPQLTIGILAPMTGPVASFGASMSSGAQMAADEWNARGGVLGRQVVTIIADGQCSSDPAISASNELVHTEGVKYIVGGVCSNESLALAGIADAQSVVQISPSSTMDMLTQNIGGGTRPYVFRACYSDSFQGMVAGKFAAETLKVRRAFLISMKGDKYSENLASSFEQSFVENGGAIAGRGEFLPQDQDYSVLLSQVAATNPEVTYMAVAYSLVNAIAYQARQKGVTTPFIGADGWDSHDLDLQATEGSYFTTHFSPDDPRLIVKDWLSKYQAHYQSQPDALAALGYDAMNLLLFAIEHAGADDPSRVAETLNGLEWEGVTGTILINDQHNPIKPAVVMQIKDGQVRYVTTVDP